MTEEIYKRFEQWLGNQLEDSDLVCELNEMRGNENAITDAFYKDLDFGTGGLRGIIGVGSNRMNIHTVARASQGYADYLKAGRKGEEIISLAVAYDNRIKSREFALRAVEVFAASGIKTYFFPELSSTPMLSYAIRQIGCNGGIVITASHNPAQYNGYKIYDKDGGQITGNTAKEIFSRIQQVALFSGIRKIDLEQAKSSGMAVEVSGRLLADYCNAVSEQAFGGKIDKKIGIVYTPLNGTGLEPVSRILKQNGFTDVTVVEEQKLPDGRFTTCPNPNPEAKDALKLAERDAEKWNKELILATDPDCDRVGAAVKTENGFRFFSGNEIGVLLFDYICRRKLEQGTMPEKPIGVKTIVTTDLIRRIGGVYGVEVIDTLTGFKYIGEVIGRLEHRGEEERFLLGMEESHGYLSGAYVRDKDGANAVLLIAEMAGYYKRSGKSLVQVLSDIYLKYGFYCSVQHTFTYSGKSGNEKMMDIMENARSLLHTFKTIGGLKIIKAEDYKTSLGYDENGSSYSINLPRSNVLKFMLEDGSSFALRPSGTEPKLKLYIEAVGESEKEAALLEQRLAKQINVFVKNQ